MPSWNTLPLALVKKPAFLKNCGIATQPEPCCLRKSVKKFRQRVRSGLRPVMKELRDGAQ